MMWLVRSENCNVDVCFDHSHGVHRDVIAIIKQANLWSHELLMLLIWNARFGPWMSKARSEQVAGCMKDFFQLMDSRSCDLFQSLLRNILRDTNDEHRLAEDGVHQEIWEHLQTLGDIVHNHGEHISMNRFLGMLAEGRREDWPLPMCSEAEV